MKTALVWGAGGDIGRALVKQLVTENWSVYAVAHRPGDRALADLTPHVLDADVSAPYEVQMAITSISQEVSRLDLRYHPSRMRLMEPAEYGRSRRLAEMIKTTGLEVEVTPNNMFLSDRAEFARDAAGKKTLLMERPSIARCGVRRAC